MLLDVHAHPTAMCAAAAPSRNSTSLASLLCSASISWDMPVRQERMPTPRSALRVLPSAGVDR